MTTPQIDEHVTRSLDALKDFQRATVNVVYDNLFNNGQKRMLVADEVGLGKTLVAKGVIARRILERPEEERSEPLKATYICSNQVIAHENVSKLDIYPDRKSHDEFASRLTYLAFEPGGDEQRLLKLNTLTPATSFNKGSSTGQQQERRILYSLLMQDEQLSSCGKALSAMLRAGVQKAASVWFEELDAERDTPCQRKLRPCCHSRFLTAIRKRRLKYSDCPLFAQLGVFIKSISLYDTVVEFSKLLTLKNLGQYRDGSDHLVRELKDALSRSHVETGVTLRHVVEAVTKALEESQGIGSIPAFERLYQFKVTLLDIKPTIWRRIQIPGCTLVDLHEYIQAAFGWENYHLRQFEIDGFRYSEPAPDGDDFDMDFEDETDVLLSRLLPKTAKRTRWIYEYDFGDGWRHEVLFEGFPPVDPKAKYPLCVKGERACPPEDCGGVWGYGDFLEAIRNPKHEEHEKMLEWIGGRFDSEDFDADAATKEMKKGLPDWRSMS